MKLPIYNLQGKKTGKTVTLKPEIFGLEANSGLIQQAVEAQRSKNRKAIAHTKTRSERRGGGAKPWRQKGTGRARAGSRRSPLWRKGGVTFGPCKEKNFTKRINRKMKRKAMFMVLSERARSRGIVVVQKLEISEPKTRAMLDFLSRFPLPDKILILLPKKAPKIRRAAKNLTKVKVLGANNLNVFDLLNYGSILMPKEAVEVIEEIYFKKRRAKSEEGKDKNKERKA